MRTKLGTFVAVSVICGLLPAYGAATPINASMSESNNLQAPSPQSDATTNTSPPPFRNGAALQQGVASDCDGQTSSTGSVMTLLSRLVRSSTMVHGVQCPIPPVPDDLTSQEAHP